MPNNNKVIAFQIDKLEELNFETDSSLLLARGLQSKGYSIFFYHVKNLYIQNNEVLAYGFFIDFESSPSTQYRLSKSMTICLESVKLIMIRQDPPFNMEYITATYLLEKISNSVPILNNLKSLRDLPEKLSTLNFPQYLPNYIVSANIDEIKRFVAKYVNVVIKPLYQHGGKDVIRLNFNDSNFVEVISDYVNRFGHIIIQEFIEDVLLSGDKRIIFVDSEVLGYFQRLPMIGDFRSNTVLGGECRTTALDQEELSICNNVSIFLKKNDIFLAGIDLLNHKLIEINITSPTGLVILNKLYNKKYEELIIEAIEKRINHGIIRGLR